MIPLRFIHCADLHLDSPFSGLQYDNPEIAKCLQSASLNAFNRLIDLAVSGQVDFVLIAGDVYDSEDRGLRAQFRFREGLKRLNDAGISSFVVHGNHDPLERWASSQSWPERTHIFGPPPGEIVYFQKEGQTAAAIQGASFPVKAVRDNLALGFSDAAEVPFHIGLLHCHLGAETSHEPYAPCSVADLQSKKIDYWALGHIHRRQIIQSSNPVIIYSGNIQGRHINEAEARGCYLVEVDETGRVEPQFISLEEVRWQTVEISVTEMETTAELITHIMEKTVQELRQDISEINLVVRIVLHGRGTLHQELNQPDKQKEMLVTLREELGASSQWVWIERFVVNTAPAIDMESRRQSSDFVGEVLRTIQGYRDDETQLRSLLTDFGKILNSAKNKLHQKDKYIQTPQNSDLAAILDKAEALLIDSLITETNEDVD